MIRKLAALSLFLAAGASVAMAQPMVVYNDGTSLFVGTGEPGSFVGSDQGAVSIREIAIDPATRNIYYLDIQNGNIGVANPSGVRTGVLSESPVDPFDMRIENGVLYYTDRGDSSGIRTINLSSGAEATLPLADAIDDFVVHTKSGKVYYGTRSSTDERIRSVNLDGIGAAEFFRPTTGTSGLELYGDTLLRSDFGASGRISSLPLPSLSPATVIKPTQSGSGAVVDMASDFANGVYYFVRAGTSPGLFRRTIALTGNADQTLITAITSPAALDVLEIPPIRVVTPSIQPLPPVVTVDVSGPKPAVTLTLEKFSGASTKKQATARVLAAALERAKAGKGKKPAGKVSFQYAVELKRTGDASGAPVKKGPLSLVKKTTKKNVLTFKNLPPDSNFTFVPFYKNASWDVQKLKHWWFFGWHPYWGGYESISNAEAFDKLKSAA